MFQQISFKRYFLRVEWVDGRNFNCTVIKKPCRVSISVKEKIQVPFDGVEIIYYVQIVLDDKSVSRIGINNKQDAIIQKVFEDCQLDN